MSFDLRNEILPVPALVTTLIQSDTATATAIIDTAGFDSLVFMAITGVVTAGDVAFTSFSGGDDSGLSDGVAIAADRIIGDLTALDATNTVSWVQINNLANQRYVAATIAADNSADLTVTITAILGNPTHSPTA